MPETTLPPPPSTQTLDTASARSQRRGEIVLQWLAGEPLVPPAIGLTVGIFLDSVVSIPFPAALAVMLAAGAMLLRLGRRIAVGHVAVALAAAALGATLHDLHFRHWPDDHLVRYTNDEPAPARVVGVVVRGPLIAPLSTGHITWIRQLPRTRLLIEAQQVEGVAGPVPASGLVAVVVREPVLGISAGDQVELFGTLHRPVPPANPGERDWTLISRRNGVLVGMSCEHASNVTVLASPDWRDRWLNVVRRRACAAIREQTFQEDEPGARLLDALVLGQRSAVDDDLNQAFINTGTVHYLSVSGAHVGVLMAFVWAVGWLVGQSRRRCAVWAILLVIAYATLTEPSPAVIRSAIMAVVFCITILARRPLRSANGLALAAIILLILRPTQLFDPGFQLSFLTLMALMYLSPRVHALGKRAYDRLLGRDDPLLQPEIQYMLNPPSWPRRVLDGALRQLGWALAISVAAWGVGALVSSYHFRQVPPWGWINTVLVTIPMSAVLLLGLVKTVLSWIFPPASFVAGWPLGMLTDALIGLIRLLDRLPGSGWRTPEMPAWLSAAGLGVLGLWIVAAPLNIRRRWAAGAAVGFALLAAWNLGPRGPADSLELHVLSVGDGTACVLQMPGGKTFMYDLGTRPPYDIQRWTVGPFLAHKRLRAIDTLVLSHPQLDHFSGVPDLLEEVHVKELVTASHFRMPGRTAGPAGRLIDYLASRSIPWRTIHAGERLHDEYGARIEVLWPPRPELLTIVGANDSSLVLRITYAGTRILL